MALKFGPRIGRFNEPKIQTFNFAIFCNFPQTGHFSAGSGALESDISIIFGSAWPRHMLQSVEMPSVQFHNDILNTIFVKN